MTYANTCDASAEGVNVVSNGECRDDGKGERCLFGDSSALSTDEFCKIADGDCRIRSSDIYGRCESKPSGHQSVGAMV